MRLPCAVAVTVALLTPAVARGQDGLTNVAAGYSYGRSDDESLHGWTASLSVRITGSLSAVGEVTGQYGTVEGTDVSRLALLAGPRFTFGRGSARPFVHLLLGAVRNSAGITVQGVSISENETDFGGAAGGGADIGRGRWAARLQVDYLLVKADDETRGDPRASVAVVYRFGH
jgi:outer membrane protein with beta-barrel domain